MKKLAARLNFAMLMTWSKMKALLVLQTNDERVPAWEIANQLT